jgi:hypothetical protein
MSAEQALLNAYSEWRRLAKAESKAICLRDWNFLLECQEAIKKIQPRITRLIREAHDEWKQSEADSVAGKKNIRVVVSELIELAKHNRMSLQAAMEAAQAKCEQIKQAGHNLKRLQFSYLSARPAAWTSFS